MRVSGKIIEVMLEHPSKALLPIVVTVSGKIIEVMLEHPEKALLPIVVTVSGRETLVTAVLSRSSL